MGFMGPPEKGRVLGLNGLAPELFTMGAEEGIPPGPEVSPDSVQLLGGFLPWIGSEAGIFAQLALIAKHRLASVSFPIAWNADFWEILPVISVLRPRNGRLGCVIFRIQQSRAFRPRFGCWCDKEDRRVNFTMRRILAGLLAMSLIAPASVRAQQPQMSMPRQPLGEETGVQANSELPLPGQPMPSPPKAQGQPASAPGRTPAPRRSRLRPAGSCRRRRKRFRQGKPRGGRQRKRPQARHSAETGGDDNGSLVFRGVWPGMHRGHLLRDLRRWKRSTARLLRRGRAHDPRPQSPHARRPFRSNAPAGQSRLAPATVQLAPGFSFGSLDQGISPGMNVTVGHFLEHDDNNRDEFVEFTFWGLDRWHSNQAIDSDAELYLTNAGLNFLPHNLYSLFPFYIGGFNRRRLQSISDASRLNNFELNYRWGPRGATRPTRALSQRTLAAGMSAGNVHLLLRRAPRIMAFDDKAEFFSEGLNYPGTTSGDYNVHTRNTMLGMQVGGECAYRQCRWSTDVHGRAGAYLNVSQCDTSIVTHAVNIDPYAGQDLNANPSMSRDVTAEEAEVGVGASYKIRPNLTGRVSYDFIWMGGLALAPEQFVFDADPKPHITNNGTMFVNGVSFSLEYTW